MGHETVKYSPDFHGFFHGKYPMKISLIYHENPVKKKSLGNAINILGKNDYIFMGFEFPLMSLD